MRTVLAEVCPQPQRGRIESAALLWAETEDF